MPELSKREKVIFIVLVFVTIGFLAMSYYAFFGRKEEIAFKLQADPAIPVGILDNEENFEDKSQIVIHIVGAVKNPGVYTLLEGDRVKDAIEIAGGALIDANLDGLNLAQKLQDEDKLYVPREGETEEETINGIISQDDGKVNINKAGLEELKTLPGIGPVMAQNIIDYRENNGPFKKLEDIKNVSGIGEKKFEQIRDKISIR